MIDESKLGHSNEAESGQPHEIKQYPVTRICSYCKKVIGLADYTSEEPNEVTHGICDECKKKLQKQIDAIKKAKNKK